MRRARLLVALAAGSVGRCRRNEKYPISPSAITGTTIPGTNCASGTPDRFSISSTLEYVGSVLSGM